MNINIRNGNVIDELKKIPDESVDCVVRSDLRSLIRYTRM